VTTLDLYGGPKKRTIIMRAYGMCGQSVTEFELTPEEYDLGLVCMNEISTEFGTAFGYNFPEYGNGSPDDESGIAQADAMGFAVRTAQEISSNIGKQFSPNGPQAAAVSALKSKYTSVPHKRLGRQTITGAGNRYGGYGWPGPYFPVTLLDGDAEFSE
jgi:hypothetical protein